MRQIYLSLIYPHLQYCSAIWGGAYTTYIDNLLVSQKKILRIMFFKSCYAHTKELFRDYKLLTIPNIIRVQTSLFIHKSLHSLNTDQSFTLFPHNATRRPFHLRLPLCRISHSKRSILSRCSQWNALPKPLITDSNFILFQRKLMKIMFNN